MPALAPITIAGLASRTGVDVESIRAYEKLGLIEKPRRVTGGYLCYSGEAIETVAFIRRATALGFSLAAVRDLLPLADPRYQGKRCARAIAERQLGEIRENIEKLTRMERALSDLAAACKPDGSGTRCPIIATLVAK
jgi:MerR family mercuric resistance operon transcriptional regulator